MPGPYAWTDVPPTTPGRRLGRKRGVGSGLRPAAFVPEDATQEDTGCAWYTTLTPQHRDSPMAERWRSLKQFPVADLAVDDLDVLHAFQSVEPLF